MRGSHGIVCSGNGTAVRYVFGELELDVTTYELRRAGVALRLQPKVFDILRYFVEQRDRLISHEELLQQLWAGEHVSDSAISWRIHQARKALGQARGSQQPIETLQRRGYRFHADVRVLDDAPAARSTPPVKAEAAIGGLAPEDPFVGREAALAELQRGFEQAYAGRGALYVLSGEAGIGKSRCAHEITQRAQAMGFRVLRGRAVETPGAPPLWPWMQVLREQLRHDPDDAAVRELLAELQAAPRADGAQAPRQDASARFWFFDRLVRALVAISARVPLCVHLDDLHWADPSSLLVFGVLAPELSHARLLVLGASRELSEAPTDEQKEALRRVLRVAAKVPLAGLEVAEVARYLQQVGGSEAERLAPALHARTVGHPLFVRETLRLLLSRGSLRAQLAPGAPVIELPEAVKDALRASLSRVQPATRELLGLASALGDALDLAVLALASERSRGEILPLIDEAVACGLLHKPIERARAQAGQAGREDQDGQAGQGDSRRKAGSSEGALGTLGVSDADDPDDADDKHAQHCRFSHDLVREVLYEDLPLTTRVAHHRALGDALEQLGDQRAGKHARLLALAFHLHRALPSGQADKALAYAERAGHAALRAFAYDQAVRAFGWALDALLQSARAQPRTHAELLVNLGVAQRYAGRTDASRTTLTRAIELSREHGFGDLLVQAAQTLRPTMSGLGMVADPEALLALEESLRLLPGDALPLRVHALSLLAVTPPYSRDMAHSKERSEQALQLAQCSADAQSQLIAQNAQLYALSGPDDLDAVLELSERMLRMQGKVPLSWVFGEAYASRARALAMRGDHAGTLRALDGQADIAQRLRYVEATFMADRLRAQALLHQGELERAQTAFVALHERGRQIGLSYSSFFFAANLADLLRETTGLSIVKDRLDPAAARMRSAWRLPDARIAFMRMFAEVGYQADARDVFEEFASAGFHAQTKDAAYLGTLVSFALVAEALDERAHAQSLYALLLPYAHLNALSSLQVAYGSVAHFLGGLARYLGDMPAASAHYALALTQHAAFGMPTKLAQTRYEYARLLTQGAGRSARAQAKQLSACALQDAQRLGMAPLRVQAQALCRALA